MRTHVKAVAIINLCYSALYLLGAVFVLFNGMFGSLMSGQIIGAVVGTIASALIAVVIGAIGVFGLIASFGLLNYQQWARYLIIAVSAFRLFKFPIGTLIGGYSLWVLFNDETKMLFDTHIG